MLVKRFHYALTRSEWEEGQKKGTYSLSWPQGRELRDIACTPENYYPFLNRMSEMYPWNLLKRNNDGSLEGRLSSPEARLFELVEKGEVIGNVFVTSLNPTARAKFFSASQDRIIEFETLGTYPGISAGRFRGKDYFEMLFKKFFERYDIIYWSQNDIHHPSLRKFYLQRLCIRDLGEDYVDEPLIGIDHHTIT